MTLERASSIPGGTRIAVDMCVIGAGAAGIAIGRQLDNSGLRIALLEAGSLSPNWELQASTFDMDELGVPLLNPEPSRGRWFGGSTNLWFGRIAMPAVIDFDERDWLDHGGWPLSLSDLEPWIGAAADILDVPNFDRIAISNWETNPTIETFHGNGTTRVEPFLWASALRMGSCYRGQLERSLNVRVFLDATVTGLFANEASTMIEHVAVDNGGGGTIQVHARAYVLAAGGIENPRLMLASTNRSESGVGNERGLVGRYYMDHPRGEGLATIDLTNLSDHQVARLAHLGERVVTDHGRAQLRVVFSEEKQRREQLLNHALHAHLVAPAHETVAFASAKRLLASERRQTTSQAPTTFRDLQEVIRGAPALARLGLQQLTRRVRPRTAILIDQMEQVPDPDSRLTVDHQRRDRYGLPRAQVRWRIGDSTYRSQVEMHRTVRTVLERHGITTMRSQVLDEAGSLPELWDMKHPSGTTRMSSSAANGVVNTDCRVHGVDNLYVVGSSVFPVVGHANPTLLIVALAARLADHLIARTRRRVA